ncbi:MAG: trigger factor [Zetaproteobacteria bacterium CG2_30_46_52]|nr:MAG: trigger factor [Zetaproteobacteria bacterium CG2_30_46_52]
MIQTEVKTLGENEYEVHVRLPKSEYQRIYAEQAGKLGSQVKLPGFRPGKTPAHVIQKQFGPKIHEDTVSALLQQHYVAAIESSGLTPAIQPELSLPAVQPEDTFDFTLKVDSWPTVELADVGKLKFEQTTVTVADEDIKAVKDRLFKSQVRYEIKEDRAAETGDQLHIDFEGFIGEEAFEGGKGADVPLVLGEGRFIPGFEDQLMGKKAGDDVVIEVTFPEDYQATNLAGKDARFVTKVKSVGQANPAKTDAELAEMLSFESAEALAEDIQKGLVKEAADASRGATQDAALGALLEANPMTLPEGLIAEDVKATTARVIQNMKQQNIQATPEMLQDEAVKAEVRDRAIRGLKLSVLLQKVRAEFDITLTDEDVDAGLDDMLASYPENMRGDYAKYIRENQEQMGALKDRLLEQKCIDHVVSKAKVKQVTKALSQWQAEQDSAAA